MTLRRMAAAVAVTALTCGGLAAVAPSAAGGQGARPASAASSAVLPSALAPAPLAFEHVGTLGDKGAGPGKLESPAGLDFFGTSLYVTDAGSHDVERWAGAIVQTFPGTPGSGSELGRFSSPTDVAVVDASTFYVADRGNHRVQRRSGGTWSAFGSQGSGPGQFAYLNGIALAPNGHVYTSDRDLGRIQEFTAEGAFVRAWGGFGDGPGQFDRLRDLAVAQDGSVYAASSDGRISVFSSTGRFLRSWKTDGDSYGIDLGPDGKVYVVQLSRDRIDVFSADGAPLASIAHGFNIAFDVDVAPDGTVRVADVQGGKIEVFRPVLAATAAPRVTGTVKLGKTLKASAGEWPVPGVTLAYQWLRDGKAIGGATSSSYSVRLADVGSRLSVRVTASRSDYASVSSATSASVKVPKLAPKVSAKLSKKKIKARSKAKLTVTVKASGIAAPTGKVQVFDGKKRLKTVSLRSKDQGRLKVTLPRLKPGKHKIKVKYLGSSKIAKKNSKKVTLTVRKK